MGLLFKFTTTAMMLTLAAQPLLAGNITLRVGPPGTGTGGTNPAGLPPSIGDLDLTVVTKSFWETSVSALPGILVGKRLMFGAGYVGVGGGIVTSANGVGVGPYTSFGMDFGGGMFKFNAEYKQALGFTSNGLTSPYAARVGVAICY